MPILSLQEFLDGKTPIYKAEEEELERMRTNAAKALAEHVDREHARLDEIAAKLPPETPNAGLPVAGYVPQSDENVAMVNRNKALEELVLRQIDAHKAAGAAYDQRWVALALTQIQQGFMALNRAVFQPQRLKGDLSDL